MSDICRVTSDLREEMTRQIHAEVRQDAIDREAKGTFENMTNGSCIGIIDTACWLDTMNEAQLRELLGEYLARLYAKPEPGITCDRAIIAREYLESSMREWCLKEAEKMEGV